MIDNYIDFKKLISELELKVSKPTLLLHSCCGPCSTSCLERLYKAFDITIFYYNPNIYPDAEFDKRLDYQLKVIEKFNSLYNTNIKILVEKESYDVYLDSVKDFTTLKEGSKRCYNCYEFRLRHLSEVASTNHFDYFSTVMSVSPYKNSDWINEIGYRVEKDSAFLYSNYKKEDGYKRSICLSKEFDLYRQDWCGCEFSLNEHNEKLNK